MIPLVVVNSAKNDSIPLRINVCSGFKNHSAFQLRNVSDDTCTWPTNTCKDKQVSEFEVNKIKDQNEQGREIHRLIK